MPRCSCAERRKSLAEIRRAVAAGNAAEAKDQARQVVRSVRRDLARLVRSVRRR